MRGYRRPPEIEDVDEDFVVVARPIDALEASLLEQALAADRIPCRVIGTRDAALLGVAQHVLAMRIEVPSSMVAAAEEIVEAIRHAEPLPEDAPSFPDETDEEDDGAPAPGEHRKRILAFGLMIAILLAMIASYVRG